MNRALKSLALLLLIAGIALASGYVLRRELALALLDAQTLPDTRAKSDVILVMGGFPYERLPFALELHQAGYAPRLVCPVAAPDPARERFESAFGFSIDEEEIVRRALGGIAGLEFTVIPGSRSTYDDLVLLRDHLADSPAASVLVVSSPYHLRRIESLRGSIFPDGGGVTFRYAHVGREEFLRGLHDPDDLPLIVINELIKQVGYVFKY